VAAEKKTDGESVLEDKNMDIAERYPADDEIDLFELFASLGQQWRWWVGITVLGVVVSIVIALSIPKQYEVTAQIAVPNTADVAAVSVRGYGAHTAGTLFERLYQQLTSGDELRRFIATTEWAEKLSPEGVGGKDGSEVAVKISKVFSASQLAPLKEKGAANDPAPTLLALTLWGEDELLAVEFLNDYISKASARLVESIKSGGIKSRELELEKTRAEIELLRDAAVRQRKLIIQKIEADNQTKVKTLSQSMDLLLKKQAIDDESRLAVLNEALKTALEMKIKKPTTIEAIAENRSKSSTTEISVTTNVRSDLFLMGSDYLKIQIKNLQSRKHKSLFVKEISSIKKQIAEVEADTVLAALKARKSDDPYIEGLPALLKKINKLEKLTFDFSGVQLYRWDKKAVVDGQAEKPKRALIVAVGSVLSLFVGIFVALIAGAVKRRKAVGA